MTEALLGVPPETVRDIGWTLLHFLWQGFVRAALLHMILPMCRIADSSCSMASALKSAGTSAKRGLTPVAVTGAPARRARAP